MGPSATGLKGFGMGTAFSYAGVQARKEDFIQMEDAIGITGRIASH
jgi:hypothetical protein